MKSPWVDVPVGAVVMGADRYEWTVREVAPDGSVTIEREGRAAVTAKPPQNALVEVVRYPTGTAAESVRTLRTVFDVSVIECAWCQGNEFEDCVCEEHCGAPGCVNFPRSTA